MKKKNNHIVHPVDYSKIKTIKDIKLIIQAIGIPMAMPEVHELLPAMQHLVGPGISFSEYQKQTKQKLVNSYKLKSIFI